MAENDNAARSAPVLAEHFFRQEYGRLVATLTRRVGAEHLQRVEDAVQGALASALESWPRHPPDNASAWLFLVARNRLVGSLRQEHRRAELLAQFERGEGEADKVEPQDAALRHEIEDDLLRMLFVCCDEDIPERSRLVFALKVLCGFSVPEIALRLFVSEANVYKRLSRTREKLQSAVKPLGAVDAQQMQLRLSSVRRVLYLLFAEGHLSSHATLAIRRELCEDALRLARLLASHPWGDTPTSRALVALMYLHLARLDGRQDRSGSLLLLHEQERSVWDHRLIHEGLRWLAGSAEGERVSRYHVEAGIAAEHCLAATVEETNWEQIADYYAQLEQLAPSPLHRLNRAIAIAEAEGPTAGLALIEDMEPPGWLVGSYLWSATLADLHVRNGSGDGKRHQRTALELAPNESVRALLRRRFEQLEYS